MRAPNLLRTPTADPHHIYMAKKKTAQSKKETTPVARPPIVAVMGHIDHGKSTLLDYIRKTNVAEGEVGGITQRLSAYEVVHTGEAGAERSITFLDTPGHEAFAAMRERGAGAADVAILVVAADDGVKPQTLEAHKTITESGMPFIVAFTKTDKPNADIERAKQSVLEAGIYLEQLGGDVPWVPISSTTGDGIDELLDMILLVADLAEPTCTPANSATGVVIEANRDPKKGIAATLIVQDGTLASGSFVIAGSAFAPVRIMENHVGKQIREATCSMPVQIIGFSELPEAGTPFAVVSSKKEAERMVAEHNEAPNEPDARVEPASDEKEEFPIILKADVAGTIDAIEYEVDKIEHPDVDIRIIDTGVGTVSESDVKRASAAEHSIIIAFNVGVDASAQNMAERLDITIVSFDIIYKLTEWLAEELARRAPSKDVEDVTGRAKVLKTFSHTKDKQVVGGTVTEGALAVGAQVRIMRRDLEIGRGVIRNLQQQKVAVSEVQEGSEFGIEVAARVEIAPGDVLEAFTVVRQ